MKRWLISTNDNAGRPAEESGEAPPSERPSTSGTERDWLVHKEDIHKQSDQPYSNVENIERNLSSMDSHASSSTKYNIPNVLCALRCLHMKA